jgi:hypothetical protein
MALSSGSRPGPYEIVALVGAGEGGKPSAPATPRYGISRKRSATSENETGRTWTATSRPGRLLCNRPDRQLNEAPARSGEIKQLGRDKLTHAIPQWLPGEKEILFVGREPGTIRAPMLRTSSAALLVPIHPREPVLIAGFLPTGSGLPSPGAPIVGQPSFPVMVGSRNRCGTRTRRDYRQPGAPAADF